MNEVVGLDVAIVACAPPNTYLIHCHELLVSGSFSQNIDEFKTALKLVSGETFPAKAIITHQFTMDEIVEAFELIEAGGSINVCVTPDL
jgi:threonine dehydrogenase-like Zn-dependent dehydrogenase